MVLVAAEEQSLSHADHGTLDLWRMDCQYVLVFVSASSLHITAMLTYTAAALHVHAPVIKRSGPVPVFSRIMSLVDDYMACVTNVGVPLICH